MSECSARVYCCISTSVLGVVCVWKVFFGGGEGVQIWGVAALSRVCAIHYVMKCVAGCCSVLQCVAVCCSVLPCVAVCCSVLQCVAVCCRVLQVQYSVLQ